MKLRRPAIIAWLLLALAVSRVDFVHSCTLWTAVGSDEQARRVVFLAKNRDWTPDHSQELRLVRGGKGHEYLGLYALGGAEPGLKAGINRQGLAIVSASASSIPRRQRELAPGERGLMRRLLASCASVEEVAQAEHLFARARPQFLLAADRQKAVVVEIAGNGKYHIDQSSASFAAHTNHFLHPALAGANRKIGASSRQRLATIKALLEQTPQPLTLDTMVTMSEDRSHGPNHSILRSGAQPDDERTLATWIVALPSGGDPTLYLKLRNPGEAEGTVALQLDQRFWRSDSKAALNTGGPYPSQP